jgi:hypothetical protein
MDSDSDSESGSYFAKLSDTNYQSWSFIMKLSLECKELDQYILTDFNVLVDAKTKELTSTAPTLETVASTIEGTEGTSPSASSTTTIPELTKKQL